MLDFILRLAADRSGATAIEYGLIVALVFLVLVSALQTWANNANAMYARINTAITTAAHP